MKKNMKALASILTVLLVSSALVGCGKTAEVKPTATLPTGQTITVWSHLNDDEVAAIRVKAEEWAKKTNNTVKVIKDLGKFEALVTASKSPSGPDITYGTPHDKLGQFVSANVALEIPKGTIDESKYTPASIEAGKYNGKQYALPIAAETYALFYNKDLVQESELPKTWDELLTLGKKVGFEYNINDFYFSYALLAGNGAYVFKTTDGKVDTTDVGLGGDGAVKGLAMIKNLVDTGLVKGSVTGDIAKGNFVAKKTGLLISGPWEISGDKGFKALKVNYGTIQLPTIGGKPTPSFMGVQVGLVNPNTKNKDLSFNLIKYLQENALTDIVKCGRMSVVKDAKSEDPLLKGFADQVKNAQPMPNVPEMAAIWEPGANALKLVTSLKATPEVAAKGMLDSIKKGIEVLK